MGDFSRGTPSRLRKACCSSEPPPRISHVSLNKFSVTGLAFADSLLHGNLNTAHRRNCYSKGPHLHYNKCTQINLTMKDGTSTYKLYNSEHRTPIYLSDNWVKGTSSSWYLPPPCPVCGFLRGIS